MINGYEHELGPMTKMLTFMKINFNQFNKCLTKVIGGQNKIPQEAATLRNNLRLPKWRPYII